MQLSLPHCRPSLHREPWRCPPSLGTTGCSPVPLTAGGSSDRRPKRLPKARGGGASTATRTFARCLAALRPSQSVSVSQSPDGTALGAALLWRRFSRTLPVSSVVLEAVTPLGEEGSESGSL